MILIIGAGLAGLVCAKELERLGVTDYQLVEAEAEPGGRVRSTVTAEGFVLDRGFQVLLDSYPAVKKHLDLKALQPRYFDSGAILQDGGQSWTVADPRRHPTRLPTSALGSEFTPRDKAKLAMLAAQVIGSRDVGLLNECASDRDYSTAHFLWLRGFSPKIIERFFRPFFGGVFLDEKLSTSAGLFRYYLKKFATGRALLPARGIGEIPKQLAGKLTPGKLRLDCRVDRLEGLGDGADAAVTTAGERLAFDHLLLATEAPATAKLLDRPALAGGAHRTTTVYFATDASLYKPAMLVLPAGRGRVVRHFAQLTNVAPEYAPTGRHLITATVLDRRGMDDGTLTRAAATEISAIYPAAADRLNPLAVIDVPYAQHLQPAGFARGLPPPPAPTHLRNVFLAGDQTTACSVQTAMMSGEQAAAFLAARVAGGKPFSWRARSRWRSCGKPAAAFPARPPACACRKTGIAFSWRTTSCTAAAWACCAMAPTGRSTRIAPAPQKRTAGRGSKPPTTPSSCIPPTAGCVFAPCSPAP